MQLWYWYNSFIGCVSQLLKYYEDLTYQLDRPSTSLPFREWYWPFKLRKLFNRQPVVINLDEVHLKVQIIGSSMVSGGTHSGFENLFRFIKINFSRRRDNLKTKLLFCHVSSVPFPNFYPSRNLPQSSTAAIIFLIQFLSLSLFLSIFFFSMFMFILQVLDFF